jgi:hypothetical protein
MLRLNITALLLLLNTLIVFSQTATIKGYVFDIESGAPIPGVNVFIQGSQLGAPTDVNGFFVIRKVPEGKYVLEATNIAYSPVKRPVDVFAEGTIQKVFYMKMKTIIIDEATVSARKQMWERNNPTSMHRITGETIKSIPGIGGESDLAEYIQVLPGVVSTGDRGGQLYIRGGSPVQNLTLLDGMTIINPFHSIGFISVFDTDIIKTADVYTSGFGAKYGGRISSVIDLKSRDGNRTKFGGKASLSTFGYNFLFEGPIREMKEGSPSSSSFLISQKRSYIDATAARFMPFLDSLGIPFMYNDIYGKVSFRNNEGDQFDLFGVFYRDRAKYPGLMETNWSNLAINAKYVYSPPRLSSLWETNFSISDYNGVMTENGRFPRKTRYNGADVHLINHHYQSLVDWSAGFGLNFYSTSYQYMSIDSIITTESHYTADIDMFAMSKFDLDKWLLEPGFQLRLFTNYMVFSPEPRLRVKYKINNSWSLNFSSGLYAQELLSTVSEEDVVKLFQGFNIGVTGIQSVFRGNKIDIPIMRAYHLSYGVSWIPDAKIRVSFDTYFKNFYQLVNYNRNKIYEDDQYHQDIIEYYRKQYIHEKGMAYGAEVLIDYKSGPYMLWIAYSLSQVSRTDEFYTYPPNYDRRHNLNLLAGYRFGVNGSFNLTVRWNLGSGMPVTQSLGLYEELQFIDGGLLQDISGNGNIDVWYGPVNGGRLPWYHRLDISLNKKWTFSPTHSFELNLGVINLYNRANVFYFDRYTFNRVDQLPILPSIGAVYRF